VLRRERHESVSPGPSWTGTFMSPTQRPELLKVGDRGIVRSWCNWQPRMPQEHVPSGVRVRLPPSAPRGCSSVWSERNLAKVEVEGSSPFIRSIPVVTQLAECLPSKQMVAGSTPVHRSIYPPTTRKEVLSEQRVLLAGGMGSLRRWRT
jgi:hypothetical protein